MHTWHSALMVAALELYFDSVARTRVRALWDAFEAASIPSLRDLTHGRHQPHLSLVSADALDPAAVRDALGGLRAAVPLRLRLDFVGVFLGRVLWLGPVPTAELLAHQAEVHGRLSTAGIGLDPYYRPGSWVPHATMSMRVPHARMTDAIKLCMDVLPIEATVVGAAVADHKRGIYQSL